MGWKGTVRSMAAVARAAERESQRRYKQELKAQAISDAAEAVDDWDQYIDSILTIHTNLANAINWRKVSEKEAPIEPILDTKLQDKSKEALELFKPKIFDFMFGGTQKRLDKINRGIEEAPKKDLDIYSRSLEDYNNDFAEWDNETKLARELIHGNVTAIKNVIEEFQSISDESLIGTNLSFKIEENHVHAMPIVHSDEIIPDYRRKLLASGKLSESKMPVGQFNELYQDYVASVALKVAGDLFQFLPLEEVYVTCLASLLNSQTGHTESMPILSVRFMRQTFKNLNLENIDPSDSMRNFNHVMQFKKSTGFSAITPLISID